LLEPAIRGTPLEEELRQALAPDVDRIDAIEGLGDAWQWVRRAFSNRREEIIDESSVQVDVGVYWLDVPDVLGAGAEFSVSTAKSTEVSATVTVLGNGGGPTSTATVKGKVGYKTKDGPVQMTITVPATAQRVAIWKGNVRELTVDRLNRFRWDERTWTARPGRPSLAGRGTPNDKPGYDNRAGPGVFSDEMEIEKGTTWKLSYGLNIPKFGINLGVDLTGDYSEAVSFSYELPPGHLYRLTRFESPPCFVWAVEAQ
jgi:hypothetical protein